MSEKETLPYSFDLFFDIKTKAHLIERLRQLREELQMLGDLIETHKIDLGEE